MTTLIDLREPIVNAYVWWCGDEICDCHMPVIELYKPNPDSRIALTTRLWEGTFVSGPGGAAFDAIEAELAAECARRGIPEGETRVRDIPDARLTPAEGRS